MRTDLSLKTQAQVLADVKVKISESANVFATDAQYYAGINEGLRMWARRVTLPRLYTFTAGFVSGTYQYALPYYITPPFQVQIRSSTYSYYGTPPAVGDNNYTWHDLVGFASEPDGAGGYLLRLPSIPYTDDARILYFAENGPVPVANFPTVGTTFNSTATSATLTVTSAPDVGDNGIIKVESEWISYAGVTRTSDTSYILLNLGRGLLGTTAASHTSTTAVSWGIAVDDQKLWVQLQDYTTAYIHALQLHKSTSEDVSRHEKLMSFYQTKADDFWKKAGYVSQRKPQMLLTTRGIGPWSW